MLVEAADDVVAEIDLAQADPAVDRRDDVRVGDVELLLVDEGLVGRDRALVLLHQGGLGVDVLLRDRVLLAQPLVAGEVELRVLQQRLVARELALVLCEQRLVGPRVDLREEVARLDRLALAEADLGEIAADLRAAPSRWRAASPCRGPGEPPACRRRHAARCPPPGPSRHRHAARRGPRLGGPWLAPRPGRSSLVPAMADRAGAQQHQDPAASGPRRNRRRRASRAGGARRLVARAPSRSGSVNSRSYLLNLNTCRWTIPKALRRPGSGPPRITARISAARPRPCPPASGAGAGCPSKYPSDQTS